MTYYDPVKWVDPSDDLISVVEEKVQADKKAKTDDKMIGFIPQNSVQMQLEIRDSNEKLQLKEWEDRSGKIYITLTTSNHVILRQGHFNNNNYHTNPNKKVIPPPHHIHFPTQKYPDLNTRPAYAYPVACGNNYIGTLTRFRDDCNIRLDGISLQLFHKGII